MTMMMLTMLMVMMVKTMMKMMMLMMMMIITLMMTLMTMIMVMTMTMIVSQCAGLCVLCVLPNPTFRAYYAPGRPCALRPVSACASVICVFPNPTFRAYYAPGLGRPCALRSGSVFASAFHCVLFNPTSSAPIILPASAGRAHCGQSVFVRFITQQIPGLAPPPASALCIANVSVREA